MHGMFYDKVHSHQLYTAHTNRKRDSQCHFCVFNWLWVEWCTELWEHIDVQASFVCKPSWPEVLLLLLFFITPLCTANPGQKKGMYGHWKTSKGSLLMSGTWAAAENGGETHSCTKPSIYSKSHSPTAQEPLPLLNTFLSVCSCDLHHVFSSFGGTNLMKVMYLFLNHSMYMGTFAWFYLSFQGV